MQRTGYKWAQYYLMYSPIWRQLNQEKINKNPSELSEKAKVMAMNQNFNSRLSLAYKVLFENEQKKAKYNPQEQFWHEQSRRIALKLRQILKKRKMDLIECESEAETDMIDYHKYSASKKFYLLGSCKSASKSHFSNQQNRNSQNISQTQKLRHFYEVDDLRKRILVKQVINILASCSKEENVNLAEIMLGMILHWFKFQSLPDIEAEQISDWIITLFVQNRVFEEINEHINNNLLEAMTSSQKSQKIEQVQINGWISFHQLLQTFKTMKDPLTKLSENDLIIINQFLHRVKLLTDQQSSAAKQLTNVFRLMRLCHEALKVQLDMNQINQVLNNKSSKQNSNKGGRQSKAQKLSQSHHQSDKFTHLYTVWKLEYLTTNLFKLLKGVDLKSKQDSFLVPIIESRTRQTNPQFQDMMLRVSNQLQQELQKILIQIDKSSKPSKTQKQTPQFSISQSVSISKCCLLIMNHSLKQEKQQKPFKQFKTNLNLIAYKLFTFHSQLLTKANFDTESLQNLVRTFKRSICKDYFPEISSIKFEVFLKTKVLSSMLKALHQRTIVDKMHIFLSQEDRTLLINRIQFLQEHKHNSQLFGTVERQHMDKIIAKIKPETKVKQL